MSENGVPIADRLGVIELLTRYSLARDDRQLDTLMECFTEDGVFIRSGREVVGKAALRSFFEQSMNRYTLTNHTAHGVALDATDKPAELTGIVPGHAELVLDGVLYVAAYRYRDTYRTVDGRWLLARRELGFIFAMPVDELRTGFADHFTVRWPGLEPAPADHPQMDIDT